MDPETPEELEVILTPLEDIVGVALSLVLLIAYASGVGMVIIKVKRSLDFPAYFTMINFVTFFVVVALSWILYTVMSFIGQTKGLNISDQLFYIGEFISWFLIMTAQTYYTFEMYLVRACLEAADQCHFLVRQKRIKVTRNLMYLF